MSTNRDNLKEFFSSTSGKIGSILLVLFILISVFVVFTYPLNFGNTIWSNPAYWSDYPKSAPPTWISIFGNENVEHQIIDFTSPVDIVPISNQEQRLYSYTFNYDSNISPTFLSLSMYDVVYHDRPPTISVSILRPDNEEVLIYREVISPPRPGEEGPYIRYSDSPFRINLSGDKSVSSNLIQFVQDKSNSQLSVNDIVGSNEKYIFSAFSPTDSQEPLTGEYKILIKFVTDSENDSISKIRFVLGGSSYGLLGTDSLGRNISVGLLFGFPIALLIGLTTSTITTMIGTAMGIISGYTGGRTDTIIQRFSDTLSNIPLLPILLFLIFIFGPQLWLVMTILVLFGWPGLTIIIRSMVLQINSSQSIEAAKSLGASKWRIMYRHIFPQLAPFIFAQLVFFTPAAILAEASLSFLGLGDPSIPTWGQILENGFRTGGVYIGYWWWILPPGLLIVITAMIFVFIALALEPVVNPKLKKM
ncbi:MAG: peptide ABC transporter permease [Thaumarchaeota archaeon]|nr:peptide ABC transporter permease [Nitrososphaerota archaeon]|tara:strand:+ start:1052 stop:2476 length:1425 start_codon:yes stop_codon:yes gene_type:complete